MFFRMVQVRSNWMDFHEISYLSIFRKFAEEIQVSLKSDNNNGHFTRRKYLSQFCLESEVFRQEL